MVVAVGAIAFVPHPSSAAGIVSFEPQRGPVGATVTIAGTGFTGATEVLVGGVSAPFTVEADDRISVTVPERASTGSIEVRAADGIVARTGPFLVLPNIVVVMTDDQRWDTLSDMRTVVQDLAGRGVTFSNAFASNPVCCPSRASFLTGRYSHDTGVWSNGAPYGGFEAFSGDRVTIATTLDAAGYETGMFGKYLNGYTATRGTYVPPGWDRWRAYGRAGGYYDYALSLDGEGLESHGSAPPDYSTDVLAEHVEEFIRSTSPQVPVFAWLALAAPHNPFTSAPRHAGAYERIEPWRPPNYDEKDISDKPAYVSKIPRLTAAQRRTFDARRRNQLATLLAVDDAVATIEATLADTGRLGDTLFVYTSDNGYLWGEHRRKGKTVPYEESIRIPLVIRWDRVRRKPRVEPRLVMNIDVPGSLAKAAGTSLPGNHGRNLLPLLSGPPDRWRSHVLLEHGGPGAPPYCGIRTVDAMYVHYATDEEEYYRLEVDPYQLSNRIRVERWSTDIRALRRKARDRCDPRPPDMPSF